MIPPVPMEQLIHRFDAPAVHALVLMGSYARGEAGPYSDIDIVRFTVGTELPGADSYLFDGQLVVVSDLTTPPAQALILTHMLPSDTIQDEHVRHRGASSLVAVVQHHWCRSG